MSLAVLFLGPPSRSALRAVPKSLRVFESTPADSAAAVAVAAVDHVLIVEPEARVTAQTFATALTLDAGGGILGGCATEPSGALRFGTVFAAAPYGPYPIEPFTLVDQTGGKLGVRPQADAIDALAPGVYLVDAAAFANAGGCDPHFGTPWRVYDLCARFRAAGLPVRWDPRLAFTLEGVALGPADAVDRRDFMRRYGAQLATRFDLETPARGGIRRPLRLPFGQREVVTIALPPTEVLVFGEGAFGPAEVRSSTHVRLAGVRDVRGDGTAAVDGLRAAMRTRSDRYLAVVEAAKTPEPRWLERMMIELESAANICAVREEGCTLFSIARIPLDVQPPDDAKTMASAIDAIVEGALRRGKTVRPQRAAPGKPQASSAASISVVIVAHSLEMYHRTSWEVLYAGDLSVDYHVVASPTRPEALSLLRSYASLDLIVDDSRSMGFGLNAALAHAKGDVVVIIADDFYPPSDWLTLVSKAFELRPDAGMIAFSSTLVEGPQQVGDPGYADMHAFRTFTTLRRTLFAREARLADRVAALALAVDARALRAVGGFDERLGGGRWGVEDLALRMRGAGYANYVAEDIFIHRFAPAHAEPLLNDSSDEARRADVFAKKWGLRPSELPGFEPAPLIARGYDPERDYVPLREIAPKERKLRESYDTVFVASCAEQRDVDAVSSALGRYLSALRTDDAALFAIGVGEEVELESVSARARALLRKLEIAPETAADIAIVPLDPTSAWLEALPPGRRRRVYDGCEVLGSLEPLEDNSPSTFRRAMSERAP